MTDSTKAFYLFPPGGGYVGGAGIVAPSGMAMAPEGAPGIIWGQGTPNGDLSPFNILNKGSIYMCLNNTDDDAHHYFKTDEGGDNDDWVKALSTPMTVAQTYVDTELHGWELNYTGTNISAANLVGLNIAFTTAGTAGGWNAALFAKITQGSTKNVNGYLCAAEFEVNQSADNVSDWFVLVLNAANNGAQQGSHSSYIALRDYGSLDLNSLLWISDHTVASNDTTVLMSSTGAKTHSHSIRIVGPGSTPYWLMVTSTGPAG